MQVATIIEKLVPGADYGGAIDNTEESYSGLRWNDEREKPTWEEIAAEAEGCDAESQIKTAAAAELKRLERSSTIDLTLWFYGLTVEQKAELIDYRQQLIDAPETLTMPTIPAWMES